MSSPQERIDLCYPTVEVEAILRGDHPRTFSQQRQGRLVLLDGCVESFVLVPRDVRRIRDDAVETTQRLDCRVVEDVQPAMLRIRNVITHGVAPREIHSLLQYIHSDDPRGRQLVRHEKTDTA
jgi:hypothetical protein